MTDATVTRGFSRPHMRRAECKDCLRDVLAGSRPAGSQFFAYPESWASGQLERGGSRSDRCREHRAAHQSHIAGIAVAYIDLETTGEVADREQPSGPLGALGPLPPAHEVADTPAVDLGSFGFGMNEDHIRAMLDSLADPARRVLVVKAGTGTGKSTYMPYKLLDPPDDCFRLAELGPIVVTEPRVQATIGVATFVGKAMSGAGGVGPGFPVGYQASGDRQHDSACQLIYVTDGTMINWLREGRLSSIGTVIVDEVHERSTNIDFIMGYLRRELDRYPHLRVIITSATFDAEFYQQYFGKKRTESIAVPAEKSIGYGWPLFPELDARPDTEDAVAAWRKMAPELALAEGPDPSAPQALITGGWRERFAPALTESEVVDAADIGYVEDLHLTTDALLPLRFTREPIPAKRWNREMPAVLGEFVARLAAGLDKADIFGDILAFLPTSKMIEKACKIVRAATAGSADVYALLSSLPADEKEAALAARRKGDRRKIVISTNLAETSLTVEGVRFVVDSGLIAQSEWDVGAVQGGVKTKSHSQAGIKQRWGRVGRKAPGWVFPLYTKAQLLELAENTPPGSTRENLENLVMTAKLGGLASVHDITWPAAFLPDPPVVLDESACAAREVFLRELDRADAALCANGALDAAGDPTALGKEISRLQVLRSSAAALAVIFADQLACVPEVVAILTLLDGKSLTGSGGLLLSDPTWPDEWRVEAAERHRALASACEDDAELVLQIVAAWERADPGTPPWEQSRTRAAWAARWWVNHDLLRTAAATRRDVLASLSPAMKEAVKRFVEPSLLRRARGAVTRAFPGLHHRFDGTAFTTADQPDGDLRLSSAVLTQPPDYSIPLQRHRTATCTYLANFVAVEPWARDAVPGGADQADVVVQLLAAARTARPEAHRDLLPAVLDAWPAGARARVQFCRDDSGRVRVASVHELLHPAALPSDAAQVRGSDADTETASDNGEIADAAPELDNRWPRPLTPVPDPDETARRSVLDHREIDADESACRVCGPCLDGDFASCSDPRGQESKPGSTVTTAPDLRHVRPAAGTNVANPLAVSASGTVLEDDSWYEIVAYTVGSAGEPALVLRADWRAASHTLGPGEHPDLAPGTAVPLIVGDPVEDHSETLRTLLRADGRGRFVLREAPADWRQQAELDQLAIALNSRDTNQLAELRQGEELVGVALPGSRAGITTVTLLDLAAHHVEQAHDGRWRAIPAVVATTRNANGYIDARLLAADSRTGIRHVLSADVGDDELTIGTPILVDLKRAPARLQLHRRRTTAVRGVVDRHSDIRIVGLPGDGEASELGTSETCVIPAGRVSTKTATELAALSLDGSWTRDIWQFWARTRHQQATNVQLGDHTAPIDVQARPRVEIPSEVRLPAARVRVLYPAGRRTTAVVVSVNDDLRRAWLRLPDGVQASVSAKDVRGTAGAALSSFLRRGKEVEGVVIGTFEKGDSATVNLTLDETTVRRSPDHSPEQSPVRAQPGILLLTEGTDPNELADALRDHAELTVSFAGLVPSLVAPYAAYLLGLASASAGGAAEWLGPEQMVVRRLQPPVPPPAATTHDPERHEISAFDATIDRLARRVRLGQPVQVDVSSAEATIGSAVRLFISGLCAHIPVNIDASDDGLTLDVYRR